MAAAAGRVNRRLVLAASALALIAISTPAAADVTRPARPAASTFIGPYTGVGSGLLDRVRHTDNQSSDPAHHIVADSTDVYAGRFTYSFRIDGFGNIEGRGNGTYQRATWHLRGVNRDQGAFECDVPMRTTAFSVRVTGQAVDGGMHIRFALEGAREANDEHYCGANFYGFASDDTRLANSLELVQPADGLAVNQANPAIAPLRKVERLGDARDSRVNTHEWSISIRASAGPPEEPPNTPVGTSTTPTQAGRAGRICTIDGTAGANRLVGTRGNDVICGFGGADTIDGRGGHDLIYGGPGNDRLIGGAGLDVLYGNAGGDRLSARDGQRDRLDGGTGRDSARIDRGRDRVRSVERAG